MASNLYQGDLLAEETHSGRVWSVAMLPVLVGPAVSVMFYRTRPATMALGFVAAIGVGVMAMMWGGFQYRFLRHGVEIRMLGFRLRTIARQQIVSYSIESWNLARGYGIRGIGSSRAYVWGNKVVHIKTTNGEVYLGHSEPERIVRDLDQVTGFVSRG
jgi:hypothetical protein